MYCIIFTHYKLPLITISFFLFIAQNQPMYYNKHRTRFFPRKRICSFGMRHLRTLTASGGWRLRRVGAELSRRRLMASALHSAPAITKSTCPFDNLSHARSWINIKIGYELAIPVCRPYRGAKDLTSHAA